MNQYHLRPEKNMSAPTVRVSHLLARIQEARLISVLLEAGWSVIANEAQTAAIETIQPFFGIRFDQVIPDSHCAIPIEIDHQIPQTSFGNVTRPLIFPSWLANLTTKFDSDKDIRLSFSGNPSKERIQSLLRMHSKVMTDSRPLPTLRIRGAMLMPNRIGNYLITHLFRSLPFYQFSKRGRKQTCKVLDIEYWQMLGRSQAVYCPAGDFEWTYRFFESMLAGAMPVVDCPLGVAPTYANGYHFHPSSQPLPSEIDSTLIQENKVRVVSMLTAKKELRPCKVLETNSRQ